MRFVRYSKEAGEPTDGFSIEFARKVYDGCPIYHHWDFPEFYIVYRQMIESVRRFEFVAYADDSDVIEASMCIYKDWDMHTGEDTMLVMVAYSEHPRALVKGYRWMYELGAELGVRWASYTHRKGPFGFITEYKRIKQWQTQ